MNCVIAILLGAAGLGRAERLAIKAYTAADGLAHNHINRIRQDAVGFLWFCTDEGLSRFDGYRFTNYTTEHGLPHPWVNDFLQSRDGAYWIATDGGVCRFNPAGPQRFVVYRPGSTLDARRVNALIEDREGIIWCGTYQGLYRLERTASQVRFQSVDIGAPAQYEGALVNNLMLDRRETLWAAARSGLYRRRTDGPWERYTTFHGLPDLFIEALAEDRAGRLWAGTRTAGFCELLSDPELERRIVRMCYSTEEGLPANDVRSTVQTSDGRMWIGGSAGLTELIPSGDGGRGQLRSYTTAHGLSDSVIYRLAEDRDGNLWIGTKHAGVMRMARQAFVTYGESEGFRPCDDISSIFETLSGDLVVSGGDSSHRLIQRFDGRSFIATDLNVSRLPANLSWAWRQPAIQDRAGEWWVATEAGLVRFPRVRRLEDLARVRPKAVYTVRDGFAEDGVRRLYLDAKGDVWIPSENGVAHALARWERATGTFRRFTGDSLPVLKSKLASAFGEDGSGRLWIGFADNGGVVRCPGREESGCLPVAGAPKGSIHALFVDHANRVWAASSEGGLARLDDPSTDQPRFVSYTAAMGLSSNEVWCLTEDR